MTPQEVADYLAIEGVAKQLRSKPWTRRQYDGVTVESSSNGQQACVYWGEGADFQIRWFGIGGRNYKVEHKY